MAIYPGAVFKPTPHGGKVKRNRQGRGMLHVAVSNAKSLPPSSATTWHFYIAKAAPNGSTDGSGGPAYCEQYVDTEYRAYGGAEGNDDQLIVETAGAMGPKVPLSSKELNAEPWTRAQVLRIADLMRWEASQPGGAPLEVLPDARPGRRGWGPHRLGIKHSGGPRPGWWQPGSELWSNSLGKECPGDAKVRQVPEIIALARQILNGEDDVSAADVFATDINYIEWDGSPASVTFGEFCQALLHRTNDVNRGGTPLSLRQETADTKGNTIDLIGRIAGLTKALEQVARAPGQAIDLKAVQEAARAGAEEALKSGVDVAVTVGGNAKPGA